MRTNAVHSRMITTERGVAMPLPMAPREIAQEVAVRIIAEDQDTVVNAVPDAMEVPEVIEAMALVVAVDVTDVTARVVDLLHDIRQHLEDRPRTDLMTVKEHPDQRKNACST